MELSVNVGNNPPPTVSAVFQNPACGEANGGAQAIGAGGDGNYIYEWNDANSQMTDTATGLSAGTYTVTVTDGVGCTASTNVTLTDVGPPTVTATAQNTTCGNTNGEATANASGGTPPLFLFME